MALGDDGPGKPIVPGTNFVERVDRATHEAARTIAVLTPEYLTSVCTRLELQAAHRDGMVRIRAVRARLPDWWAALTEDGRYRVEGDPAARFWYVVGQCRFEAGELDPYLPAIRRRGEEEVF